MEAFWTIILHHIPEACLIYWVGLGLVGAKLPLRRVLPVGGAVGVLVHLFRIVLFPWHVVALMVVHAIIQRFYFRVSWKTSLASVFISFILINVGEALLALVVFPVFSLSPERVFATPLLYVVVGWVALMPLALAAFGSYGRGWTIIPLHVKSSQDTRV